MGGRMSTIFIKGNVPSSKNSKIMTKNGIFHSKTVRKYLQNLGIKKYSSKGYENYKTRDNLFEKAVWSMKKTLKDKPLPHLIGFYFIRGTRHKFDIINAMQIICDLLVAHGVIEDDNADCLIPRSVSIMGKWYEYNKEDPGVILEY